MRIVSLVAGAGEMMCGSCLHSGALAAALRRAGHDCLFVPLYTPVRAEEETGSLDRVAFGGVNVFLQQHSAIFRHTPWFLDRLFDHPWFLRWAMRRGEGVRPETLGALTVSMLKGEEGRQRKELERLVGWLERDLHPDIVHLSTALLIGVARQIVERLHVPVVCTLSGEDLFLDRLPEPHQTIAWETLRERAGEATLIAMSRYYADEMAMRLGTPREHIHVIPPALNLEGHGMRCHQAGPVRIGFLSRIAPEKGLRNLLEALKTLASDPSVPPVCVQAAGYLDPADRSYLADLQRDAAVSGLADRFTYRGELDRAGKIAFLQSCDVFSTPTISRESKGLPVLEAWANAVPAVLPAHGAFCELVEDTDGGLLYPPNDSAALAQTLKRMVLSPDFAAACGRKAQQAVQERYNATKAAERMLEIYQNSH